MKQKPTDYRNRIKALEYVNAADLTPHPGNWRDHPAAQAEALKGVLAEVGIAGALLAYRSERQGGWAEFCGWEQGLRDASKGKTS